ncbi:MAG TPA: AMP-binding protein [Patescibacteria group bacterium]|nr:AMP-binding protein [Patescibacteria group bacterium]
MSDAGPIFGRDVPDAAWRPTADLLGEARLAIFLRAAGEPDLHALQARAVADPAWFWGAAVDDLDLAWQRRPVQVMDASGGPEWTRWWRGGAFNHAEAATGPRAARDPEGEAVAWEGEDGTVRRLSNLELRDEVVVAARMFAAQGIRPGDRVGIFLPMLVETVVATLALGRLGAIFTPIFSGYGAPAVAARLHDCEATVLVTADGFLRRGQPVAMKATADAAAALTPSVRRLIVVRRLGRRTSSARPARAVEAGPEHDGGAANATPWHADRDRWWDESIDAARAAMIDEAGPDDALDTDPETPYMLIYTSGTTGSPKGAVHVHGGFPIKAAQDLAHTFDLRRGDALFWFTDLGWMMGPWAISGALLLGARLVLYEGAPDFPGPDRLWDLAARHRVTHLGLSPTVVRALIPHGREPVLAHDLSALRVLGSTGEPWDPESWWWYFREVGRGRTPVVNYSGGTEVSGGIVGCNVLTPIKPASFNGPCIGTAADVAGPDGASLRGEVGELVIRAPQPGMTRGFWQDPNRYLDTYWSRLPGTWVHGDWAIVDRDGYWFIRGRSDDTLKVAGKRVGPAEVEAAATAHPSVVEAAAIGVPHAVKGEAIVVVCTIARGETDDDELRAAIGRRVVADLGKTLKPEAVVIVAALPKTRSGKIMRRVVRAAWLGLDPGDLSALDDPTTIEAIRRSGPAGAATT